MRNAAAFAPNNTHYGTGGGTSGDDEEEEMEEVVVEEEEEEEEAQNQGRKNNKMGAHGQQLHRWRPDPLQRNRHVAHFRSCVSRSRGSTGISPSMRAMPTLGTRRGQELGRLGYVAQVSLKPSARPLESPPPPPPPRTPPPRFPFAALMARSRRGPIDC